MPTFEYSVKDRSGKSHKGSEQADTQEMLITRLRSQGYLIVSIRELKETSVFGIKAGGGSKKKMGKGGGIKLDDLVVFARQMATLVGSGIPLIQTLEILTGQVEKEKFRQVLRKIHSDVQSGASLSESMQKHIKVFSALFVYMVRAGEQSGSLEEILERVSSYLEKSANLQKKVKSAMMYPAVVTGMAFIITFGMLAFVIPKFATIFEGLGGTLPAPTQFLIDLSNVLAANWWWILPGIVGGLFGFKQLLRIKSILIQWDSFTLKMPIFGELLTKVAVSKFSRTLATLIKSGVAILPALEIVSKTAGNARLEEVILSLTVSVKKGESISGPLDKSNVFPQMVTRMIAIGEETGELEAMLIKISDFYDAQVDAAVDGLTSLIEPLIIAFLGVVIGGIVIALFLPILTLTQNL